MIKKRFLPQAVKVFAPLPRVLIRKPISRHVKIAGEQ